MRAKVFAVSLALVTGSVAFWTQAVFSADANVSGANSSFEDSVSGSDITTINVGDTVTWTFDDAVPHTVTSDTGVFSSGAQQIGGSYAFTFNDPGTYPYYCQVHGAPGGLGMAGTVIVQAASTNTPQATNTSASGVTNTPTRTPTRTRTPVPTSTGTVTAVPTSPADTATPIVALPISATEPPAVNGGARPAVTAPTVGTGDAADDGIRADVLVIALAIAGIAMLGAAATVRRRI